MVKRKQKIMFLSKRKGVLDIYYPKSGIFKTYNFSMNKMTKAQAGSYNYYTKTGLRIRSIKPKLSVDERKALYKARSKARQKL
tara:strand:+ start:1009 stop:1257 length:249 start_codon:yes stop_codon:yes gene_type:complete